MRDNKNAFRDKSLLAPRNRDFSEASSRLADFAGGKRDMAADLFALGE